MVEIIGTLEKSVQVNGTRELTWRIPALTATGAKQRARGNARFKGLSNFTVQEPVKIGSRRYEVTVSV